MRAALFLHRCFPPFAPIRELRSVINIDRVHGRNKPGQLSFDVALSEGEPFDSALVTGTGLMAWTLTPTQLHEGSVIIDRSTERLEPWMWYVNRISHDLDEGSAHVECQEWRQLLYERAIPLSIAGSSLSAPQQARQLISAGGGRNPHHIRSMSGSLGARHLLPAEALSVGGQTIGAALDLLAQRTNSEWWLDYQITWHSATPLLRWSSRRGRDLSGVIVEDEGFHLASAGYIRSVRDAASLVSFVGGSGGPSERAIASIAFGSLQATARAPVGGQMEAAPEKDKRDSRNVLSGKGAAATAEKVVILPDEQSPGALMVSSRQWSEQRIQPLESLELTLRGNPLLALHSVGVPAWAQEVHLWEHLRLGDRFMVRLESSYLNERIDIPVRVFALQPDEAEGELVIAVDVDR